MIAIFLFLALLFSMTVFFTKRWIRIARFSGLTGKDMNKPNEVMVAEAGGISFLIVFSFAILSYIFIKTFLYGDVFYMFTEIVTLFAILTCILFAGFIGFVDDVLGWKRGLKQFHKTLLTLPIAIPLMVINSGESVMVLPFIGAADFGTLYPLIIIPLGVIGATNGFNMLAGLNGLEAGMGAIILSFLGIVALEQDLGWLALICFASVAALLGFLVYNKYPSQVFPGDTLTYSLGALIAAVAITGNMEKIAVILFVPYIIEFLLKFRSRFKAEVFGIYHKGVLRSRYNKVYSIAHFMMRFNLSEKQIVYLLYLFEILLGAIVLFTL